MNVLVIGAGAREHAIAWKIRQSPKVDKLFAAPGNAGTASIAVNLPISPTDLDGLLKAVLERNIGLTIVGPETPLAMGIVDLFKSKGLAIFGPTKGAAQIEASKAFAKELMQKYGIPTAKSATFVSNKEAAEHVRKQPMPLVVKADGLASGKGVFIAGTVEEALRAIHECMESKTFGAAGEKVVIEEYLEGQEVSVFAFTDGTHVSDLVAACDYKRALDNDEGLNTGGMGSYSPPPFWTKKFSSEIKDKILDPTIRAMAADGVPFTGVLYVGLMVTKDGPKVLEFNCRLGDPECQVILPRLKSDLIDVILSVLRGDLSETKLEWSKEAAVGVVMASGGYPGKYQVGYSIEGLDKVAEGVMVFHAGAKLEAGSATRRSKVMTDGGRVLTVTTTGRTLAEAREEAYANVRRITFKDAHYRKDIASGL